MEPKKKQKQRNRKSASFAYRKPGSRLFNTDSESSALKSAAAFFSDSLYFGDDTLHNIQQIKVQYSILQG